MDRKPLMPEEARAQAAERLLNRKRMGMEIAIEALESVGYAVRQSESGRYKVYPPEIVIPTAIAAEPKPPQRQPMPEGFLAEYPAMLSTKDVAEITRMAVTSVRRLCKEGKLPSSKVGGRVMVQKDLFIAMLENQGGALQ